MIPTRKTDREVKSCAVIAKKNAPFRVKLTRPWAGGSANPPIISGAWNTR
jgi:hypothetical protein